MSHIDKTNKILTDLKTVINIWARDLSRYTEKEFCTVTNASDWTVGQLYHHLIVETLLLNLKKINDCYALQTNKHTSKNLYGKLLFSCGTMPPLKFKIRGAKSNIAKQPSSIVETKFRLKQIEDHIQEIESNLNKLTSAKAKAQHPTLGYLTAIEWLELIEIHFRHHLRQKARIDKALGKQDTGTSNNYVKLLKGKIQPEKFYMEQIYRAFTCFLRPQRVAVSLVTLFIIVNIIWCDPSDANTCIVVKWIENCEYLKCEKP